MNRVTLTDGSGRWFDLEKATPFYEDARSEGGNFVSVIAGPYNSETLYRTTGGKWVRHWTTQWEHSADTWVLIDNAEAARWLSICGHGPHPSCEAEFAALEIV